MRKAASLWIGLALMIGCGGPLEDRNLPGDIESNASALIGQSGCVLSGSSADDKDGAEAVNRIRRNPALNWPCLTAVVGGSALKDTAASHALYLGNSLWDYQTTSGHAWCVPGLGGECTSICESLGNKRQVVRNAFCWPDTDDLVQFRRLWFGFNNQNAPGSDEVNVNFSDTGTAYTSDGQSVVNTFAKAMETPWGQAAILDRRVGAVAFSRNIRSVPFFGFNIAATWEVVPNPQMPLSGATQVQYPFPGSTGVKRSWDGKEGSLHVWHLSPSFGWPSTSVATFYDPTFVISGVSAGFAELPSMAVTNVVIENTKAGLYQMWGQAPFKANTTYRAFLDGRFNGGPITHVQWDFTTGSI